MFPIRNFSENDNEIDVVVNTTLYQATVISINYNFYGIFGVFEENLKLIKSD